MGLFKRIAASSAVVGLLFVSGAALADDGSIDPTVSDGVTVADTSSDITMDATNGNDTNSDDNTNSDNLPTVPPTCDTLRPAESIDVTGALVDYVNVGTEKFEFHSGIVDANEIDEDALMAAFAAEGFVGSEDFIASLDSFNDPNVDLSKIQGIQSVTVIHTWGATCTGNEWAGTAALNASRFEFEVVFPTTGDSSFSMGVLFDGRPVGIVLMDGGEREPIEHLQALNDKEFSIGDFLTEMNFFGGALNADFPKENEACGKHTVQFVDDEYIWSAVTVVYPGSAEECNSLTPPPVPPATNPPGNSQTIPPANGGNQGTSYGSFTRFLGSNSSRYTPVAPRLPVNPPVQDTESSDEPTVDNPVDEPALPETGDDTGKGDNKSDAASITGAESSASTALFALAACVGIGAVAAASVIMVRRIKR